MTFKLNHRLEADSLFIVDLELCQLRLINDNHYPWVILVPRVDGVTEIIDLGDEQQRVLWKESAVVSECLNTLFKADKLNIGMLGNVGSQLHIHHIARFKTDRTWPSPVWGQHEMKAYEQSASHLLITKIKDYLRN